MPAGLQAARPHIPTVAGQNTAARPCRSLASVAEPRLLLQVDAEQYYGELEEKLTDEFNAERNRITLKRLDMAFVTFQDERMTAV